MPNINLVEITLPNGVDKLRYVSCDVLFHGDYVGAGSVGVANIRSIKEEHENSIMRVSLECLQEAGYKNPYFMYKETLDEIASEKPELIEAYSLHGYKRLYIRDDVDKENEYIKKLAEYPLWDEEAHSEVEMEWEDEAWTDYVKSDLMRALPDKLQESVEQLDDKDIYTAYRNAMELTNTYPVYELDGASIDVERIAEEFATQVGKVAAGLCPICGETVTIIGDTTDGRIIGSCHDAFTKKQWSDK